MTWQEIVDVAITLNTAGSTREGFGLPIFITSTDRFEERVRGYTSLADVATDLGEMSHAYMAAKALWSQTPKVTQLYIARRDMQYIVSIPDVIQGQTEYALTIYTNGGVSNNITYTTQESGDDAKKVFDKLKEAVEAIEAIKNKVKVTVSGAGSSASMLIQAENPDVDFVRAIDTADSGKFLISATASDTAESILSSIDAYTTDYYFVAVDEREKTFVTQMSEAVEARKKIFFTCTNDSKSLIGEDITSANDLAALLANKKMSRTVVLWHHNASIDYPEMAFIAYGAPYDAGSIAWGNALLTGVEFSRQTIGGRPLTSSQKAALEARNCNYIDLDGGLSVVRHGKVSSGEWIDIIRGIDWQESDLKTSLRDLLVNQKGGKITYDDIGITRVRQVIETSLQRGVNRNFLTSFKVSVPKSADVSLQDKRSRILKDVRFEAVLAGAILDVVLRGTVAYE